MSQDVDPSVSPEQAAVDSVVNVWFSMVAMLNPDWFHAVEAVSEIVVLETVVPPPLAMVIVPERVLLEEIVRVPDIVPMHSVDVHVAEAALQAESAMVPLEIAIVLPLFVYAP